MKIVVTGSSGFIGRRLLPLLKAGGHQVEALRRDELAEPPPEKFAGAGALVHLAGIAHARGIAMAQYQAVNRDLPERLARAARTAGVGRFVFVSSTHAQSHAHTAYGASKAEAEVRLLAMDGIEIVIARPTLVYGPGVKANFRLLLRLARLPLPLPLGSAANRRSMVFVDNLTSGLAFLAEAEGVAGQTFIVADPGPTLSVAEIVRLLRSGMGRGAMLFPVPGLPRLLARAGLTGIADRLFGEAAFDGSALLAAGWRPPFTAAEGLAATARESG